MTTVRLHVASAARAGSAEQSSASRLGEWLFAPAAAQCAADAGGFLQSRDVRVHLRYSAPLLEAFVSTMDQIEADSDRCFETLLPEDQPIGRDSDA